MHAGNCWMNSFKSPLIFHPGIGRQNWYTVYRQSIEGNPSLWLVLHCFHFKIERNNITNFDQTPRTVHVGIVGAGIGGLAAAIAISQAGARVTVLEAAEELGEVCLQHLDHDG